MFAMISIGCIFIVFVGISIYILWWAHYKIDMLSTFGSYILLDILFDKNNIIYIQFL